MKHTDITPDLYKYLLNISLREHPVLKELREFSSQHPLFVMQISPDQAQFFQFLIRTIKAKKILELGTYMGYSALTFALAMPPDGKIITCDINPNYQDIAKKFWNMAKQETKIDLRIGPALESMQQLIATGHSNTFDFIFIDADKTNYLNYYELALELISPTGIIAIDNIFWDGKVIDPDEHNGQTKTIRLLNERIRDDARVNISLLPIADGVFLVQKV